MRKELYTDSQPKSMISTLQGFISDGASQKRGRGQKVGTEEQSGKMLAQNQQRFLKKSQEIHFSKCGRREGNHGRDIQRVGDTQKTCHR